ncbi:MAG UNVERIFIED_CONTAM: hypothetical protein LVR18_07240 [Planctomycetaceae bacterium]
MMKPRNASSDVSRPGVAPGGETARRGPVGSEGRPARSRGTLGTGPGGRGISERLTEAGGAIGSLEGGRNAGVLGGAAGLGVGTAAGPG